MARKIDSKALLKQVLEENSQHHEDSEKANLLKRRNQDIEAGKISFRHFCNLMNPSFFRSSRTFQDTLCNTLQAMYEKTLINENTGKPYDKLIINLPPGHGKSYTAGMFAAWAFGQNIKNQVITVSYNQTLSTRFAKTVREMIQDKEILNDLSYFVPTSFFPKLQIKDGDGAMDIWSLKGAYMSYLATSFSGSITGMRGNIGIIDDPIKNKEEAVNERVKEAHWDWYKNTFLSRMVEGAIQIIIMTRWASDDLAGKLIAAFPDECYVLEMPVLSESGEALCDEILSLEAIEDKRRGIDEEIFQANYMQQPIDKTGALYGTFKTYDVDVLDYNAFERIINYTDTADTGADFLCSICAGVIDKYAYITDIYYTDESMEITEPETARRIHLYKVREIAIESNNGGRGFARNVESILKNAYKNTVAIITWFYQSKNKKARIIVNSANVMEQVIMPEGWERKYPDFYKAITKYQRKGKNAHDDAADSLTGIVEIVNGEVKLQQKLKSLAKSLFGL